MAAPRIISGTWNKRARTDSGAVKQATEDSIVTGDIKPFDQAVETGVSADLCESLGMLRECATVAAVTISLGWAPARPEPAHVPTHHEFTPDALEYINPAGRSLRERSPVDDFEILGIVIDRPASDPYQASDSLAGVATVLTDVDGRPRKVRVARFGDDWSKAHDAMKHGLLLSCRGELTREGESFVLKSPRSIELFAAADVDV